MLIYTGGGYGGSVPNIPARDLSDGEAEQFGGAAQLIATGLYQKAEAPLSPSKSKPKSEINLGVSNSEATPAGQTLAARKE